MSDTPTHEDFERAMVRIDDNLQTMARCDDNPENCDMPDTWYHGDPQHNSCLLGCPIKEGDTTTARAYVAQVERERDRYRDMVPIEFEPEDDYERDELAYLVRMGVASREAGKE